MSTRYEGEINRVAGAAGVPLAVAQAMVDTENIKRDPKAIGDVGSSLGRSIGLTQITLRTARGMGFTGTAGELMFPTTNLKWGFKYLRRMFDRVGRGVWSRAVAAYNAGPDLRPWPAAHVARFNRHYQRWRARYGEGKAPPPTLAAGVGGTVLMMLIVGLALPLLFKKR